MDGHSQVPLAAQVGAVLRAHRIKAGIDVDGLAFRLHVRRRYIEAIESGRYGDLPNGVYAAGFVRAYARQVGLNPAEVARAFRAEAPDLNHAPAPLQFPSPPPEGGVPKGALILAGVLMAATAYAYWYLFSSDDRVAQLITPAPPGIELPVPDSELAPAGMRPVASQSVTSQGDVSKKGSHALNRETSSPALALHETDAVTARLNHAPVVSAGPSAPAQTAAAARQTVPATVDGEKSRVGLGSSPGKDEKNVGVDGTLAGTPILSEPVEEPSRGGLPVPLPRPTDQGVSSMGTSVSDEIPPKGQPSSASVPADSEPAPLPSAIDTVASHLPEAPPVTPLVPPTSALAAEPPADTAIPAVISDGGRVMLRARSDSWIEVRDASRNRLVTARLLRAGEALSIPDRPGLRLFTGNAGGLEVLVDGRTAAPLGREGLVRRNISLDPEMLRNGGDALN